MIQINGNLLDTSLVRAGDKLTLGLTGNQPIDELLAMLNPETAPEIRVLDDEGGTAAIYRGHALTAVTIEPGEPRRITATLQVQPIEQRDAGKAVLLVSLELDEVLEVPDRILVMYEGAIVGELDPRYTTAKELGLYMAGAQRNA